MGMVLSRLIPAHREWQHSDQTVGWDRRLFFLLVGVTVCCKPVNSKP